MSIERNPQSDTSLAQSRNALLSQLSDAARKVLLPDLEHVNLKAGHLISEPLQSADHFYFPHSMVCSLVTVMRDGRTVEAATVGNEGVAGIAAFLGDGQMTTRCIVQINGEGHRIEKKALLDAMNAFPRLGLLLKRYTQVFINQLTQSIACNSLHSTHQRCARWLLMTHDRVGETDTFELTQEFLSFMLGVRREGISGASRSLKGQGIIRYARGRVTILDRRGLENASCECYHATRGEYLRLSQ